MLYVDLSFNIISVVRTPFYYIFEFAAEKIIRITGRHLQVKFILYLDSWNNISMGLSYYYYRGFG